MFLLRNRLPLPFFAAWWILCGAHVRCQAGDQALRLDEGIAYFETHIRPLFIRHCFGCHSEQANREEGGLTLDRPASWLRGGSQGPAVVPGDAAGSLLMAAVRYERDDLQMPPTQKLDASDLASLEHWITIGAPAPADILSTPENASDPDLGKTHWAFQPLPRLQAPFIRQADWPRGPIDRWVLQRLEESGLLPAADGNRRTVARRLSMILTGLPLSIEKANAIEADSSPEALEKFVDQLLASPDFGERWGRHWLDLARYADSNGLDENFLFREAWRYRNWVFQAFRDDIPFDRFVTLQLAGDLLPYDTIAQRDSQRIAAGFLVIGPKVLLGNDPQNQRMEIADEQLDSIGRAILGQTLGCARCHDHKFDPIPTSDYYALAGIMTSTEVTEQRFMLNEQRVMEQLVGLGPDGEELDHSYERYWRERGALEKQKAQSAAALDLVKQGNLDSLRQLAQEYPNAVAAEALDTAISSDLRIAAQQTKLDALTKAWNEPPSIPPRAMIPRDKPEPVDESIRVSGRFSDVGDQVPRGFLRVLCDGPAPLFPKDSSGRLLLAQWLTDPQQRSGQLAARVLANRIWHHLFGQGLVRTVDNFGRTGELPTHPELLDYLAQRLIDSQWSVKTVVREIVLSRTFQLSSQHNPTNHRMDPDNRYLWRAPRRRLDPEAFRDSILHLAGKLDFTPMDSTVWYLGDQATAVGANLVRRRTDFPCRSVYLPVIRNDLPELFAIFDYADPHETTGMRPQTMVPAQGLFFLNDEMIMDSATAVVQKVLDSAPAATLQDQIERLYELVFVAAPTDDEVVILEQATKRFLKPVEGEHSAEELSRALALVCHAMIVSSRFHYLP